MKIPNRWSPPHNNIPWIGKKPEPVPPPAPPRPSYPVWLICGQLLIAACWLIMVFRHAPEPTPPRPEVTAKDIVSLFPGSMSAGNCLGMDGTAQPCDSHDGARWVPAGSAQGPPLSQVKRFELYDGGYCEGDSADPNVKRKGIWCHDHSNQPDATMAKINKQFLALAGNCVLDDGSGKLKDTGTSCGGGSYGVIQYNSSAVTAPVICQSGGICSTTSTGLPVR